MTIPNNHQSNSSSTRITHVARLILSVVFAATGSSYGVWWWLNKPPDQIERFPDGSFFEWTDCWFQKSFPYVSHCAFLHTDSVQQGVSHTRVAVVVLRAWSWTRRPEPVLFVSGGPGAPVNLEPDTISYWRRWQKRSVPGRDLVLFDPRGVGHSEPHVDCPELYGVLRELFPVNLSKDEEFRRGDDALQRCYEKLKLRGVNFAALSTLRTVDDARKIMAGVAPKASWVIYAISYGTRVTLELMRDNTTRLHAVILDSVYPPEINDLSTWPWLANNVLETLSQGCRKDARCQSAYPDIRNLFQEARAAITRTPVTLDVVKRDTGESIPMVLNGDRLFGLIFFSMYHWQRVIEVPHALHGVTVGDYTVIRGFMEDYLNTAMDASFSDPVYHTVECTDSQDISQDMFEAEVAKYPLVADIVRVDWKYQNCGRWREGRTGGGVTPEPVKSSVPTLVLSGEFDPTTPPAWARAVVTQLSSGVHLVFPGMGHGVVDSHDCAEIVMRDFLREPARPPQSECLNLFNNTSFALPVSIPLSVTTHP